MIEEIKNITKENAGKYEYFGIRVDDHDYAVGDIARKSHQWWQDEFNADEGDEYNEEMHCWDGGELDGTCAIDITDKDLSNDKLEEIKSHYIGEHIYLMASDSIEIGNDPGEIIMEDAVILGKWKY